MYNSNGLETAESFRKLVSKERFRKLQGFALKMHSMFANKYVCESTSSTMKQVQSKNRNWMAHETLEDSLRLATADTSLTPYSLLYQYY